MRYYEMYLAGSPDQWLLNEPLSMEGREIEWDLSMGRPYVGPPPVSMAIVAEGPPVPFHITTFGVVVASRCVIDTIQRVCPDDIQRFPVIIGDRIEGYEVVNIVHTVDCIDRERTEHIRENAADPTRYTTVAGLAIDPARATGHHIFRVERWLSSIVVSETLHDVLRRVRNLGVLMRVAS